MTDPQSILNGARSILLVDWPTRDVPNSLALAGMDVAVHGGPGPEDWFSYDVVDGEVVERRVGVPPERADVVYTYRPLDELPGIVEQAVAVGARTVWVHSGATADGERYPVGCWLSDDNAASARATVEAAGLVYVDQPYIADVARQRRA
jgi:hypothetical protein